MKKRYFIYWKSRNIDGNIILSIDWDNVDLKEVIENIINSLEEERPDLNFKSISIPFMVQLN